MPPCWRIATARGSRSMSPRFGNQRGRRRLRLGSAFPSADARSHPSRGNAEPAAHCDGRQGRRTTDALFHGTAQDACDSLGRDATTGSATDGSTATPRETPASKPGRGDSVRLLAAVCRAFHREPMSRATSQLAHSLSRMDG
eukprot:364721-Chlamydomonas_euryale.AAC.23